MHMYQLKGILEKVDRDIIRVDVLDDIGVGVEVVA